MSAFDGVKVLDCSQGLAGPMAAMHLADFGAEVLKIEPPAGDSAKDRPGYLGWNRNKSVLNLDLAAPKDRARFDALLAATDVAGRSTTGRRRSPRLVLRASRLTAAHPSLSTCGPRRSGPPARGAIFRPITPC